MGILEATQHWQGADGEDRPAPNIERTHPLIMLARIATVLDVADDMTERGDIEQGERDDVARSIVDRVLRADVLAQRAQHSMWHAGRTTGETSPVAPAPDVIERVRASTRQTRTNQGVTVNMVSVHGRAYVQGSTTVRPHPEHSMSAQRASAMLDETGRTVTGRDALDVYRATQVLYGHSIPDLIGADVLSFAEFGAWDDVRARAPKKGAGTRYRLPTAHKRASEQGAPCELLAPCDVGIERDDVPALIERDENGRVIGKVNGRTRTRTVPAHRVFIGHRAIVRGATVRESRAQRARVLDESLIVRECDDVAHVLASVVASVEHGDQYRARFEFGTVRGTVTVSTTGLYSMRAGADIERVKARTLPAFERGIARVLADQ